jgi:hypothetical protein
MTGQKGDFEAYSYRTSSRFGSRVEVCVDGETVTVTGPRIGILLYRMWIAVQVGLLALIVPALLAAAILWDWRYLILALALLVAHWAISGLGAVIFWEGAVVAAFDHGGQPTTSFPVGAVRRVKIGRGWARNGLWLVILPYVAQLNKISEGRVVSLEAPDGDTRGDAVYAFHMYGEDDAAALAALLEGK